MDTVVVIGLIGWLPRSQVELLLSGLFTIYILLITPAVVHGKAYTEIAIHVHMHAAGASSLVSVMLVFSMMGDAKSIAL